MATDCTVDEVRDWLFKAIPALVTTDPTELTSLNCFIEMVIKCNPVSVWCSLQCQAAGLHAAHFLVIVGALSTTADAAGTLKREETEYSEYEFFQVEGILNNPMMETKYGRAYTSLKQTCVINMPGFLIDC